MWRHSKKIFYFNDIFPQKLFNIISFWKHLYVLVLQIVQRRVSQVYQDNVLANWPCDAQIHAKHIEHHSKNMKKQDFVDLGPAVTCRNNLTMLFFTYVYSTLVYEL